MALGVVSDATWEQDTVQMAPGDVLVLYSDGVTEAHNRENALLGEARVVRFQRVHDLRHYLGRPRRDGIRLRVVHAPPGPGRRGKGELEPVHATTIKVIDGLVTGTIHELASTLPIHRWASATSRTTWQGVTTSGS